jgi:hypothetical protein
MKRKGTHLNAAGVTFAAGFAFVGAPEGWILYVTQVESAANDSVTRHMAPNGRLGF